MLGPIPNSLGAGAYNGSFIPHGLVTFSARVVFAFPDRFQQICLVAVLHPDVAMDAELLEMLPVVAVLNPDFSTPAVLHDTLTTDAELLRTLAFDSIVEEC